MRGGGGGGLRETQRNNRGRTARLFKVFAFTIVTTSCQTEAFTAKAWQIRATGTTSGGKSIEKQDIFQLFFYTHFIDGYDEKKVYYIVVSLVIIVITFIRTEACRRHYRYPAYQYRTEDTQIALF